MTRFDKLSLAISLPPVLAVALLIFWGDIQSGMWKLDLLSLAGVSAIMLGLLATYALSRHLPTSRLELTHRHRDLAITAAMFAFGADAVFVAMMAIFIGHPPWVWFVLIPLMAIGVIFLVLTAVIHGVLNGRSKP